MAKEKIKYYNIAKVKSLLTEYIILLGQRSNGKSYSVKNDIGLQDSWDFINGITETLRYCPTGSKGYKGEVVLRPTGLFIYLRRWKEDLTAKTVKNYFADSKQYIKKLTKGQYEGVTAYSGEIYFYYTDEKGHEIKSEPIGSYHALNASERYKSQAFPDYTNIIYEEFITDRVYLDDEPILLQQYVSTIFRLHKGTVYLIGNTISRVCPYFKEWCLEGVLKQKQGTIEVYHHHMTDGKSEDTVINIAVEYCASAEASNTMFFGQSAKQIVSGEWETKDVPKLPRKQTDYCKVYEVLIQYQSFKFVIELLVERWHGGMICFVYPFTGKRKFRRIITDEFSDSIYKSARLDMNRKPEQYINECFRLNKVCYSDNLTGADFKQVNAQFKIGSLF